MDGGGRCDLPCTPLCPVDLLNEKTVPSHLGLCCSLCALLRYSHHVEIKRSLLSTCSVEITVGNFTKDDTIHILPNLVDQGSANCGPRARGGPPPIFVQPELRMVFTFYNGWGKNIKRIIFKSCEIIRTIQITISVIKFLLGCSHAHLLTHCPKLLLPYEGRIEHL